MRICILVFLSSLLLGACASLPLANSTTATDCPIPMTPAVFDVDRLEGEWAVLVDDMGREYAVPRDCDAPRYEPGMSWSHGKRDLQRERRVQRDVHRLMESFRDSASVRH
ncbi:MAG: hypothetical protein CMH54_03575 [Myxococcales bacterium]|nr:hypothetical protein [Myxococcales bacterium]